MIKNTWYAVLDAKEVPKNKLVGVTRFGEKLVFWRTTNGDVNCIFDRCCHRGAALHKGKIVHNHVQCPFHGFEYDALGHVTLIPANGKKTPVPERFKVNAYIAKEAYGFIWVWYGAYREVLPEIPFFKNLKRGFTYSSFSETWPVHYSRAIENQLDVVHLPFVHRTTIGRGDKTLVHGPVVDWNQDLMTFYVLNKTDEGETPLKPNEIPDYKKNFHLQLQMPNTWQNLISDQVRIVAAFAPIDETHTHIYLRFYHRFGNFPVVKQFIGLSANWMNRIILHQDRRVVSTQFPKKSELKMDEKLIQGDLPIMAYRKHREEMKSMAD